MSEAPLDYRTPPAVDSARELRVALRLRRVCGFILLASLIFELLNAADGSRFQFEAVGLFMVCLLAYLFTALIVWVVRARDAIKARSVQRKSKG